MLSAAEEGAMPIAAIFSFGAGVIKYLPYLAIKKSTLYAATIYRSSTESVQPIVAKRNNNTTVLTVPCPPRKMLGHEP